MNWMIGICVILVLTSFSGTIAFLIWKLWAVCMERRKKLRWIYPMLALVELFFIIPLAWGIVMLCGAGRDSRLPDNPVIGIVCTIVVAVWALVTVMNLAAYVRKVRRLRRILQEECAPAEKEIKDLSNDIQERLGLRQRVLVFQSSLFEVPTVVNGFRRRIIFPAWKYDSRDAEVILCHELTHVKQGVLTLKMIGSVLRMVYWFNPFMHAYMRELDEWGETACDVSVRYDGGCVENFREYFTVVLSTVEQRLDATAEYTQLMKMKGIEKRIMRVENYSREKDWRLAEGLAALMMFCLTCVMAIAVVGIGLENIMR